ncbi:hypothetical protein G9F72_026360 [Clostridium estertheticum]|uniref:hypothetical protein n=1 Tax=Clostridium estertheticum TaxID=238834 RepID=UPI0013E8F77E|nr:hypothetical protein [Clostridium estertheticum]MBZ9689800.1 hypothetical protein [Clostridium estertheticum]
MLLPSLLPLKYFYLIYCKNKRGGTLARLSKDGKQEQVKALIKSFGVTKLTEIPKEKYGELLNGTNSIN